MATKSLMDQFIAFAAPVNSEAKSNDPIAIFFGKIERQIGFAEQAKRGDKINQRSAWFRPEGAGYRIKIGREALKFGEHQWFLADSLDEVIERLKLARQVIEASDTLRAQIAANSKARGERMQGARKAKKPA